MPKQKFYVVWKGRKPGIYTTWEDCSDQVNGYAGAEYKSFPTREAAKAAYEGVYESYKGQPAARTNWLFAPNPPVTPSLCVDAACSGSPGPLEYQGVDTETGKGIFRRGPFDAGTNNVGEFLAIVHALSWLEKQGKSLPIYSDSETAIGWVKKGKCGTKLVRTEKNAELFELIARAEEWLQKHAIARSAGRASRPSDEAIQLLKWDTAAWGEIPADFGRK